ncbi:MAG: hypothetical protein AAF483_19865 [Planctomycetota bacterium]
MNNRLKVLIAIAVAAGLLLMLPLITQRQGKNSSEVVAQRLKNSKNKSDSLRSGMSYLQRMSPFNRAQTAKETQLALNTWLQRANLKAVDFKPSIKVNELDAKLRELVGCGKEPSQTFAYIDIDYLYQCRITKHLSDWIVKFPLRDSLILPIIEEKQKQISEAEGNKLLEAYKLFDWTMRNVGLDADLVASVTVKAPNPVIGFQDLGKSFSGGPGFTYLPWETLLFSKADFIEKGRVFTTLAAQRGIRTAWIVDAGKIFAIGVLIDGEILLFEPKLAMPILDPDKRTLATLQDAKENSRVLRRLDLPGRFDYAFNPGDLNFLELFVDLPPVAASFRMQMLEQELLGDERMTLFHDVDDIVEQFEKAAPKATVKVWDIPLKAQIHASLMRPKLIQKTPDVRDYMVEHALWITENPAAEGRLKHLFGKFEKTMDDDGALSLYMSCRYDSESLRRLEFDPEVQRGFGLMKKPSQTKEQYQQDVIGAMVVMRKAKVDSAFLLAQAHFDRGNFKEASSWFDGRIINNEKTMEKELSARWVLLSRYCLARAYQELGDVEKMEEELSFSLPQTGFINPHEAGNRLRLRYLRELNENDADTETEPANGTASAP